MHTVCLYLPDCGQLDNNICPSHDKLKKIVMYSGTQDSSSKVLLVRLCFLQLTLKIYSKDKSKDFLLKKIGQISKL